MIIVDKLVDLYYAVKFKAEDLVFTVKDKIDALLGRDPYAVNSEADYVVEDVVEEKPKKKRGRKPGTKTKKKKK